MMLRTSLSGRSADPASGTRILGTRTLLCAGDSGGGGCRLDRRLLAERKLPAIVAIHPDAHVGVGLAAAIGRLLRDHQRDFRAEVEDAHGGDGIARGARPCAEP